MKVGEQGAQAPDESLEGLAGKLLVYLRGILPRCALDAT